MPHDMQRLLPVTRIREDAVETSDDSVATEEPLEIRVAGKSVAVVMRTPGHDRELAAGFLVSEGLLRHRDDVLDMVKCRGGAAGADGGSATPTNIIDVILAADAKVDLSRLSRHVFTSSSCGICSKATIEAVQQQFAPVGAPKFRAPAEQLTTYPEKLRAAQATFATTGGLHASALFNRRGELFILREDVGRHNAVDKVIGYGFLAQLLPLTDYVLLVSGRVSFEIMQKALAAGIPCVAAISAPTTAAVDFARASGQTLVGFLREGRMNLYAGSLAD